MKRLTAGEVLVTALVISLALVTTVAVARPNEEAVAAKKAEREAAKEARQANHEKAKEDIEARKDAGKAKATEHREKVVDNRENRQTKRIQHGISKGYLTADEVKTLQAQQDSITTLESSLKADGKITNSEFKQLRSALNEASRCIWSEKHDTDGNQMPAYRLGKNVYANSTLTAKMADENLSAADAKALLRDFRRSVELKRLLSAGTMSDEERTKLQDEYDALLNTYFETR